MPMFITTEESASNQELTKHIAQHSDELYLQIGLWTIKSVIRMLISVQIIQVDPCGSGWEKLIKRQQSHIYTVFQFQLP